MTAIRTSQQDDPVKVKQRQVWALGDYPALAADLVDDLGRALVDLLEVRSGERVLDVAAGSGNASIPAARVGAHVVAADLTPQLLEAGRRRAAGLDVDIDWREADAEALPFPNSSFDVVMSCLGVMFAPHHRTSADELLRVCRPEGRIGLLSWTPTGFIGQLFATMKAFAAAPPPGAQPPPLWGLEPHVRELLGDRVGDLTAQTRSLEVTAFASGHQFRDYFKTYYGPTIATYHGLRDDRQRVAALDANLADLADRSIRAGVMGWEYLMITARRL